MSRRDDLTSSSRGTQKPASLPETLKPKRATPPEYDSDQIPVLIRLPDLTPPPQAREPAEQEVPCPQNPIRDDDPSGLPEETTKNRRKKSRRSRTEAGARRHDSEVRRTISPGLWKSFPSHVVVLAVLIGLTSLVYVLVQGGSGEGQGQPEAASVTTENMAAQLGSVQETPPTLETPTPDLELWPADGGQASREPDGSQPQPTLVGQAETTAVDTPASQPEFEAFTSLSAVGSATGADRSAQSEPANAWPSTTLENTQTTSAEGPQLTWQGEPVADDDVSPVQGWPPELGVASPAPDASNPATNSGNQQRFPSPAGQPPTGGQDPSTSLGRDSSVRTGMRDETQWPLPSGDGLPETATFEGTVEPPQPRVDYERTRSGIY